MALIHIARRGKTLGKFTPEDIARGLASGRFEPTDLVWQDPMPAWVRLAEFDGLPKLEPEPPPPPPPPARPAWERWREMGILAAAAETVTEILGRPAEVFRNLPPAIRARRSLSFFLLMGSITGWVALGYQYAAYKIYPESLQDFAKVLPGLTLDNFFALTAIITPFSVLLFSSLMAIGNYAALRILWKPPVKFAAVFRIFAYAWGAASAAQLIPVLGGFLYPILGMTLTTIGLREALGVGPLASAVAAASPILLCLGGALALQTSLL